MMIIEMIGISPINMASESLLYWIDITVSVIEVIAVAIILFSVIKGTIIFLLQTMQKKLEVEERYKIYKHGLGRALLLGLEILVAADVIHTVALELTLQSVAVLGLLVVIRTFLSWSLVVEIEGRWPWVPRHSE